MLESVLKGIRRSLGDPVNRKLPITPDLLLALLRILDLGKLQDCSIWAAALVMFYGMLRKSNVLPQTPATFDPSRHLRRKDISFYRDHLVLHIQWTKTIQYRERTLDIPLPRLSDHPLCPLTAVFKAWHMSPAAAQDGPAFVVDAGGSVPLTAQKFLAVFRQSLETAKLDSRQYGLHSFRRGGASWAYQCGMPVVTIHQIGDWRSNAYQKYIFPSTESLKVAMTSIVDPLRSTYSTARAFGPAHGPNDRT